MAKERPQDIFIGGVRLLSGLGKKEVTHRGSHRDKEYATKLGAFRNAFIAMHFVPIVDEANYHVAKRSAETNQEKCPLPCIQFENEARANARHDDGQDHR